MQQGTLTIAAMSDDANRIAEAHGFTQGNVGEAIALMHSELSEALEAHRKPNDYPTTEDQWKHIDEEMADVVIRVGNFMAARGRDLESAVIAKMEKNRNRPFKHGGKSY